MAKGIIYTVNIHTVKTHTHVSHVKALEANATIRQIEMNHDEF